jgi:hypothetical protein
MFIVHPNGIFKAKLKESTPEGLVVETEKKDGPYYGGRYLVQKVYCLEEACYQWWRLFAAHEVVIIDGKIVEYMRLSESHSGEFFAHLLTSSGIDTTLKDEDTINSAAVLFQKLKKIFFA